MGRTEGKGKFGNGFQRPREEKKASGSHMSREEGLEMAPPWPLIGTIDMVLAFWVCELKKDSAKKDCERRLSRGGLLGK